MRAGFPRIRSDSSRTASRRGRILWTYHVNMRPEAMKCTVCGAELKATRTDLPFKVRETGIVILKNVPVVQCANCPQYLLEDAVVGRVDEILARGQRLRHLLSQASRGRLSAALLLCTSAITVMVQR